MVGETKEERLSDAFMTLELKSKGLEEAFFSASRDMVLDDAEYAENACLAILDAIEVIKRLSKDDEGEG